MADIEKILEAAEYCLTNGKCTECKFSNGRMFATCRYLIEDALALLKEHDAVVRQWTKEIADNQLAHAPKDSHVFMSLDEHLENEYKRGIWDGLQIAWNIISEGR